jgi:hypothetical protein
MSYFSLSGCYCGFTTHHLLTETNVYQSDMHTSDIFIHWFDDNL